jgi:hypothetical protein
MSGTRCDRLAVMNKSTITTDCDEIQRWAEERDGKPTAVKGTSHGAGDPGMIRIDFPDYSGGDKLQPISWDQWCKKFNDSNLALIIQYETADGQISHFNRLVSRDTLEEVAEQRGKPQRTRRVAARARTSGARRDAGARGRRARATTSRTRSGRTAASARSEESGRTSGRAGEQTGGTRRGAGERATGRTTRRAGEQKGRTTRRAGEDTGRSTAGRAGGSKAATGRRTRELGGSTESTERTPRRAASRARPMERASTGKSARASRSR